MASTAAADVIADLSVAVRKGNGHHRSDECKTAPRDGEIGNLSY